MKNQLESKEAGFTRTDLLAVITVGTLAGLLVLPAVGGISRDGASDLCQDNQRQIMRALHLYAADNGDYLPFQTERNPALVGPLWINHDMVTDSTNSAKLRDPQYSQIANYLGTTRNVYRCPADTSSVDSNGQSVPKVRSVSMSNAVGTDADSPGGKKPTPGTWLGGNYPLTFRRYARLADMVAPRPSQLWVIIDESATSINDTRFASIGPGQPTAIYRWVDWPATYHNNGAGIAFGDGHAEIKAWAAPATSQKPPPVTEQSLLDINWLAERTTAPTTQQ